LNEGLKENEKKSKLHGIYNEKKESGHTLFLILFLLSLLSLLFLMIDSI